MDLWALHVKNSTRTPILLKNSSPEIPVSLNLGKKVNSSRKVGDCGFFEIRVLRKRRVFTSSLVIRAMAKKNHENPGMRFFSFYLLLLFFCAGVLM